MFLTIGLCYFSEVDSSSSMALSTISALAEARRTSFLRGRWVYTDNGGDHLYQIVEPSLPGTGDYSAYNIWGKIHCLTESCPLQELDSVVFIQDFSKHQYDGIWAECRKIQLLQFHSLAGFCTMLME